MAEVYDKAGEHTVILAVREALLQPFEATDWLDLRVGFFLSITDATADDTITGLTDSIGASDAVEIPWADRVVIGVLGGTNANNFVFCGYTNKGQSVHQNGDSRGRSQLVASNASGAAGTDYWRVDNALSDRYATAIIQNHINRVRGTTGERMHFPQANIGTTGPAGYAALHALRFTRPDARTRAKLITMQVTHDPTVLLYSSDPSLDILQSELESFPTTGVHTLGPVELNRVPDSLYLYWPFHLSRLRVHSAGILKAG